MEASVWKTKPFKHQAVAFDLGHEQRAYGYFMEMGTGKTKVAIDNANFLYERKEINDVIVLAPNSVTPTGLKKLRIILNYNLIFLFGKHTT